MSILTLINIPSQGAAMGSSYTPALGQYGVNIKEFCNVFNIKTKNVIEGFPINVCINAISKDKFEFIYIKLSFSFFIKFFIKKFNVKKSSLTLRDLFIVFSANNFISGILFPTKAEFKSLLSYAKTFNNLLILE